MSDYFNGLPFVAGDVRGVRSWDVDQLGRLISPTYRTVWTPGENNADCKKDQRAFTMPTYTFTIGGGGGGGTSLVSTEAEPAESEPAVADEQTPVEPVEPEPHTQEKCACGFYAYSNGRNDYDHKTRITGVIQGYGETQLGTRGFKCAKATILAIHVPENAAKKVTRGHVTTHSTHFERVRDNYPDVQVFAKYADMLAAFPTYEHIPTPDTDPDFWTRGI